MFGIALVAPEILQNENYSEDGLKSYGLYTTDPDALSTDTQKWTIESPIYVGRS